ncbi:MAG: ABC transporter substrate-binding protein [Sediminibacterium sp.]|nr:ABC transporter substrate-binding protein [Sediminibacterium sp.]
MKNLFLLSSLFFTITIANLSCKEEQKKQELQKVKVAQYGDVFLYMPLYLANEKGFFKEEGLEVEINSTGGDDKTFAAVIGGSAEFGIADPSFVAIANEKGQAGKVIASVVNGVPFWGVTNKPNLQPITNDKDLKGLSVATFPSPSTAYTLQYDMFKKAGLKPNIRQAAYGALLSLLESKEVDIALEVEPNVSTALQNGAKIVYSLTQKYGNFAFTGVTVSDNLIKAKPELVQKFVNALQKAELFGHKYPDSLAYYAQKHFNTINSLVLKDASLRIISSNTFPKNVLITPDAWRKACTLRFEVGDLKSLENTFSVYDTSFATNAIKMIK